MVHLTTKKGGIRPLSKTRLSSFDMLLYGVAIRRHPPAASSHPGVHQGSTVPVVAASAAEDGYRHCRFVPPPRPIQAAGTHARARDPFLLLKLRVPQAECELPLHECCG